jgi:hypothetical protein
MTMDVHVVDTWLFPEEMVVERRYFETVVQECRHHWVDFILRQDEVAHEHLHLLLALGHGNPPPESERRRRLDSGNCHREVGSRDVDLQDALFEVALAVEHRQHRLIVRGHGLSGQRARVHEQRGSQRTDDDFH